ncbi:Glycosyl transferases group 1 [Candidatus Burarchaeum australiense]|nr:Glycosyl transferases group 1 [Candidatus Burarchaeum australiense]
MGETGGGREIRVLMDFGASGRHHSLYDELLQAPPEGIRYVVPRLPVSRFPKAAVHIYHRIRSGLEGKVDLAAVARRVNRAAAGSGADHDVVHFANHLDPAREPFVADFEQALSLLHAPTGTGRVEADFARIREARTRLMESAECKFLLPWTEQGAKTVWAAFPSAKIRKKTKVVRLAMRVPEEHKPIKHDKFRVLFLGTSNLSGEWNFYYRGGHRMLKVFERFARGRKGSVELVVTGEIPQRERPLTERIGCCRAAGLLRKEEMGHLFRTSDVLLYPAYATPGLAFLEAMRYHMPIATTDAWANREIVGHMENGLVTPFTEFKTRGKFGLPPMLDAFMDFELNCSDTGLENGLVQSLEKLYGSPRLRSRLGENGFRQVSAGKCSIGERNRRLRKIYEACLS